MDDDIVKTDLLIVGAGPAGASLACFLASHGLRAPNCLSASIGTDQSQGARVL